jgi:hypothetical protein
LALTDIVVANPSWVRLATNPRRIRPDQVGGAELQVIKGNSAFDKPREKLKSYFSRGDLFIASHLHLSFVCGAATDTLPGSNERSMRSLFVEYVQNSTSARLLCIRAETAATELLRQLEERKRINLSQFEKLIADTVDSVLLFPESPGSFAELGYFSAFDDIADKSLVAVKEKHQGASFLILGPIHRISARSNYKPMPIVIGENINASMQVIVERLVGDAASRRPYRERFEKHAWKDYGSRAQLSILDEIIAIIGAITEKDLQHAIEDIFGAYDIARVRMHLSLLSAMDRLVRNDNGDMFSTGRGQNLMACDAGERVTEVSRWVSAYAEHLPDVAVEMDRLRHEQN